MAVNIIKENSIITNREMEFLNARDRRTHHSFKVNVRSTFLTRNYNKSLWQGWVDQKEEQDGLLGRLVAYRPDTQDSGA